MSKKIYSGRRGLIEIAERNGKQIATKHAKDPSVVGAIRKEAVLLQLLNDQGVDFVPQLTAVGEEWFSYRRITGIHFQDAWKHANQNEKLHLAHGLVDAAYTLDKAGVVHGELSRPTKNVLVTPDRTVAVIDFERGTCNQFSGKNMKAVAQRLNRVGYLSLDQVKGLGTLSAEHIHGILKKSLLQDTTTSSGRWLVGCGVMLDLISKYLFYNRERGSETLLLTPTFNPGIGRSLPVPLYFVLVITAAIIVGLVRMIRKHQIHQRGGLLLLSGAIGNFIDRVRLSGVRDFIDLHYRPIFNIADILVTIGAILIVWDEIKRS